MFQEKFKLLDNLVLLVSKFDGSPFIATGSLDNSLEVYDLTQELDGELIYKGKNNNLHEISLIDEEVLVSITRDNYISIWNIKSKQRKFGQLLAYSIECCLTLSSCNFVIGTASGELCHAKWNKNTSMLSLSFLNSLHRGPIRSLCSTINYFCSVSEEKIQIWQKESRESAGSFDVSFNNDVMCSAINGEYIAVGLESKGCWIYDKIGVKNSKIMEVHTAGISSVYLASNKPYLVIFCKYGDVEMYHVPSGHLLWSTKTKSFIQTSISVSEHNFIISGYDNSSFHLTNYFIGRLKHSALENLFCLVFHDHTKIDKQSLYTFLQKDYIESLEDFYCAHFLIMFAQNSGIFENFDDNVKKYFERNVYLPATEVITLDSEFLYDIFMHAEKMEIIPERSSLFLERQHRTEMKIESLHEKISDLSNRINETNATVIELSRIVNNVTKEVNSNREIINNIRENLEFLSKAMIQREQRAIFVATAKAVISLLPILGNSLGNAVALVIEAAKDPASAAIDLEDALRSTKLDVGNLQTLDTLVQAAEIESNNSTPLSIRRFRDIFKNAVSQTKFTTLHKLRQVITETEKISCNFPYQTPDKTEERCDALPKINEIFVSRRNLEVNLEKEDTMQASVSSLETELLWDEKSELIKNEARKQYINAINNAKIKHQDTRSLSLYETSQYINKAMINLQQICYCNVEVSAENLKARLDIMYYNSRIDMVEEGVFVDLVLDICYEAEIRQEYRNFFQSRIRGGEPFLPVSIAIDTVNNSQTMLQKKKYITVSKLESHNSIRKAFKQFDDGDKVVQEGEFIDAAIFLFNKNYHRRQDNKCCWII